MRKQDLKRQAVIGQIAHSPRDEAEAVMSRLLEAVPFRIKNSQSFSCDSPKIFAKILKIPMSNLPDTVTAWQNRLTDDAIWQRNDAIKRLTWDGAQYRISYQVKRETGETVWVEEIGERLAGREAQATDICGVIRVIDRDKAEIQKAAYSAYFDGLSGLMNKNRFEDCLNQIAALMQRQRNTSVMIRMRATNLNDINRIYGFDTGDKLVAMLGERLSDLLRAPDYVARINETDFGLCIIDADADGAAVILDRLKDPILDTPYQTPHGGLYLEFSNAVTIIGEQGFGAGEILRQTELVYETQGHDYGWAPYFYSTDMGLKSLANAAQSDDTNMADDIIAALNERRVSLAYQPIIDARTRDLHHYECLLRLRREDGEIVSAGSVIMAAERLNLVHLLDRRALELAAETLRQMRDIHLALNVSAATLKDDDAVENYIKALRALGPDAKRITLELTETAALDDPGLASYFSVETRRLGCAFSIDDFGSGYTTFRNLMAIEADSIKIDGQYIQGIAKEPYKETFVRMMVDLAQTFSVKTVAEMVDNRADAELLRRLGVDYLQGYLFGIPSAAPAWRRQSA